MPAEAAVSPPVRMPMAPFSATAVRTLLAHDQLPPGLLPQKVAEYIREQGIYRPLVV